MGMVVVLVVDVDVDVDVDVGGVLMIFACFDGLDVGMALVVGGVGPSRAGCQRLDVESAA